MVGRLILFGVAAGAGWLIYTRVRRTQADPDGEEGGVSPDDGEQGGLRERVSQAAGSVASAARGAASAAGSVAQAPVERVRSLVGGTGDDESPADGQFAEGSPATAEGGAVGTATVVDDAEAGAPDAPTKAEAAPLPAAFADLEKQSSPPDQPPNPAGGGSTSAREASPPSPPATVASERAPQGGGAEAAEESDLKVKGNVRSDGERIYHLPGDPAYERTNAEVMFATPEEAEAAGFRRAGRPSG